MIKDKGYKFLVSTLTVMIFIVLLMLGGNILMGDSKYKISASNKVEGYAVDDTEIFKQIFNLSCSVLEYANVMDGGLSTKDYVTAQMKDKLGFDSLSTKNLIESQLTFLKDFEDVMVVEKYIEDTTSEDEDIHGVYDISEYTEVSIEGDVAYNDNDDYINDIIVIDETDKPKSDEPETPVVETPSGDKLFQEVEMISTAVPPPKKVEHDMSKPLFFIYHTHGTESYRPEKVGNYHSLNRKYTVRSVGDALTNHLEGYGIKVMHNDKVHDYPSYQGSYNRSLDTLKTNLSQDKNLKVVLDLHRDGINMVDELDSASYNTIRESSVVTINGESVATFSIVLGGGNENIKELKQFAYHIKAVSDKLYPGLAGKIIIKQSTKFKYKFNQYKSDYSALLEIGNNTNTIDEAIATTKYLSNVLVHSVKTFVVDSSN